MKNILFVIFSILIIFPQVSFAQSASSPAAYTKEWYDQQALIRAQWIKDHITEIQASDEVSKKYYDHQAHIRAQWIKDHLAQIQASDKASKAYYDSQAQIRAEAISKANTLNSSPS